LTVSCECSHPVLAFLERLDHELAEITSRPGYEDLLLSIIHCRTLSRHKASLPAATGPVLTPRVD
jgi:hypothetical protein